MTLNYSDRWVEIHGGDCRDVLRTLPEASVHTVVTSPPYYALRDYGTAAWVGGDDPECDHRPPTRHQAQGATSLRAGRSNVEEQRNENIAGACAKCGAIKVEPTIWGGDREHEHVWSTPHGPAEKPRFTGLSNIVEDRLIAPGDTCACGAWRGALGLEPTPEMYVEHLVEVMREVRRVLRPDGTVWLNLGDSYASSSTYSAPSTMKSENGWKQEQQRQPAVYAKSIGLKPKDLVGAPWLVAFALRADGWWLRKDIIWAKPNPMPESTEDRPTSSHEHVFLLARSEIYYYDADAIREPAVYADPLAGRRVSRRDVVDPLGLDRRPSGWAESDDHVTRTGRYKTPTGWNPGDTADDKIGRYKTAETPNARGRRQAPEPGEPGAFHPLGKNKRDVWTIATEPYPEAHFATFPTKLVEPCILAGTSGHGVCPECGTPWERIVERQVPVDVGRSEASKLRDAEGLSGQATSTAQRRLGQAYQDQLNSTPAVTTGWRPTCAHYERTSEWPRLPARGRDEPDDEYVEREAAVTRKRAELLPLWEGAAIAPAVVLDPFAGSGTVGLVAQQLRRRAVLVDLNPEYLGQMLARASREWGVGGKRLVDDGTGKPKRLHLGNGHVVESIWEGNDGYEDGRDPVADGERAATAG